MTTAISLAWLAVGLVVLASPARAAQRPRWQVPVAAAWGMRLAALAALVFGGAGLSPAYGCALASAGVLLAVMASASVAALVLPLWPRGYVASVVASGAIAVLGATLR